MNKERRHFEILSVVGGNNIKIDLKNKIDPS
jgi:hypothetical protein